MEHWILRDNNFHSLHALKAPKKRVFIGVQDGNIGQKWLILFWYQY